MKKSNIKIMILSLFSIVSLEPIIGASQSVTAKRSNLRVQSDFMKSVSHQQYYTLLHQLYVMEYNINKLRQNKKYALLRSKVRRLLCQVKCNYKYNLLNQKKYNSIQKKATKVQKEIQRIMKKAV